MESFFGGFFPVEVLAVSVGFVDEILASFGVLEEVVDLFCEFLGSLWFGAFFVEGEGVGGEVFLEAGVVGDDCGGAMGHCFEWWEAKAFVE